MKLEDLHGFGGKWYRVKSDQGAEIGEIMQVLASLNRVIGWTFKGCGDSPTKTHRIYKTGKDALAALIKSINQPGLAGN